jgi:predicted ABC-type ATPase
MIDRLDEFAKSGKNFAFETTCAGRRHSVFLKKCRSLGYRITLIYLWLPSADFAIARVAQRVREGGHRIPNEVVVRRYAAGLHNMRHLYLPLADIAHIYDNAAQQGTPIMSCVANGSFIVHDSDRWSQIEEATR